MWGKCPTWDTDILQCSLMIPSTSGEAGMIPREPAMYYMPLMSVSVSSFPWESFSHVSGSMWTQHLHLNKENRCETFNLNDHNIELYGFPLLKGLTVTGIPQRYRGWTYIWKSQVQTPTQLWSWSWLSHSQFHLPHRAFVRMNYWKGNMVYADLSSLKEG